MSTKPNEEKHAPLADYFFIAGMESAAIFDSRPASNGAASSPFLESTIEEVTTPVSGPESDSRSPTDATSPSHKRFSWDARKSISSIKNLESSAKSSGSARSSATIKPIQSHDNANGTADNRKTFTEEDFEAALRKFALDRDSVVTEIKFSAGQTSQPDKPAPARRPKTQRLGAEDLQPKDEGLKSGVGSVRRRLSTMNRLQKSGTARRTSARMSKRISGYNSVIPTPQRFQHDPNMHPLKRRYEPVLLDQYPSKDMTDDIKPSVPFPDYVPMFVFPNDVNVISSDEKPRPTWHGFAMTTGDGSRLYGITLILWIPLKIDAAHELEQQCEGWRQKNMSKAEREYADELGKRLAGARAKLSILLSQLAASASNEEERERKEEEISETEEAISVLTDMLRPVRHAAAAKIDGLTDGETGMWMPRAYGVLGREGSLTGFWKEWLRVVAVPMSNSAVLRVPPSSPRVGMWQPLERYVVNLCAEAVSPITSKTQVELAIRELRMYARKGALNEIPGSRNTDLYALFRSLDIQVIITLFEFLLAESRIILLSSYTSMLHLASQALVQLLYPFKWESVFIPVLPARLIQALEAPCPYICGIERRYENVDIPDDDIVLVDLDNGTIEATAPPPPLPSQQRRKLTSILQLAAPHRLTYGVPVGPPSYATEAFPNDSFASENPSVFRSTASASNLSHLANLPSDKFGASASPNQPKSPPVFNVFSAARANSQGVDTPGAASYHSRSESPSSSSPRDSPLSAHFPTQRNESSNSLQTSLREKRSGRFDNIRRQSTLAADRKISLGGMPRPNPSFASSGHHPSSSISSVSTDGYNSGSSYAPSVYAQSTLAASTIMPHILQQSVHNTETTQWMEGHCMRRAEAAPNSNCMICEEKADEGVFRCAGCGTLAHGRCIPLINLVCPDAFHPDQIMAAFIRCFASLLYTYRKHLTVRRPKPAPSSLNPKAAAKDRDKDKIFNFNKDGFLRSLPRDTADFVANMAETQAFSEFIYERETHRPEDPAIRLFDDVILSKRNRGKASILGKSKTPSFIADTSDHLWRSASAHMSSTRSAGPTQVGRAPAKLDRVLCRETRVLGVPRMGVAKPRRKQVPSMMVQGEFAE